MGIVDWEPRTLPSEARCERWAKQGGAFLACDVHGAVMVMPSPAEPREYAFAASSAEGGVRVRSWLKGEPAGWDATFYPMTHPPIPEGWEAVGEWFLWGKGSRHPEYDATLTDEGEMIGKGKRATKIPMYGCHVRRALPAIPEGWEAVGEWRKTEAREALSEDEVWFLDSGALFRTADGIRGGYAVRVRRVPLPADWGDVPKGVWMHANGGLHGCMCVRRGDGTICGTVSRKEGEWHSNSLAAASEHEAHRSLPAAIIALTGRRE